MNEPNLFSFWKLFNVATHNLFGITVFKDFHISTNSSTIRMSPSLIEYNKKLC